MNEKSKATLQNLNGQGGRDHHDAAMKKQIQRVGRELKIIYIKETQKHSLK